MARIITDKEIKEVPDGSELKKPCEEMGVPFGCESGVCRTCELEIVEGEDNLTELSENEKELGMDKKNRLACQCKLKKGDVKVKIKWEM